MNKPSRFPFQKPSLSIDTFDVWILGRQFPESQDSWDGNWLRVIAACKGKGSRVEVSGPILDTVSFTRFVAQLEAMESSLSGSAELSSVEPELKLVLSFTDSLGHIEGRLEITGDHMLERHVFLLSLDQSFIPGVLGELRKIVAQYPVIGVRA